MHCLGGGRHNDPWWNWQEMWRCWRIESEQFNGAKEWNTHYFGMQWWKWKEKQENSTLVFSKEVFFFQRMWGFFWLILERLAILLRGWNQKPGNREKEAHRKAGPEFFAAHLSHLVAPDYYLMKQSGSWWIWTHLNITFHNQYSNLVAKMLASIRSHC